MTSEEVAAYLAEIGSKGGKVKGPKGFARMDEARALEIRQAGAKAMWAKKRAAVKAAGKKLAKVAGGKRTGKKAAVK